MWINQSYQSEEFIEKLKYCWDNRREKYIYDANFSLNLYHELLKVAKFGFEKGFEGKNDEYKKICFNHNDPQLLATIFAMISITHNKDNLGEYIKDESLMELMSSTMEATNKTWVQSHTMRGREINLRENGNYIISPKDLISDLLPDYTKEFDIDEWIIDYDDKIIDISKKDKIIIDGKEFNTKIISYKKKGSTIITFINTKNGYKTKIKVNSGPIKQANISEFFFTQIRNIIAHGRYDIVNSGNYDTYKGEFGTFDMKLYDDRYYSGLQRYINLYDKNQLNLAYGGGNAINLLYIIYLSKVLYIKDENDFVEIISFFSSIFFKDNCNIVSIIHKLKEMGDKTNILETLIILSKFYINFVYNYDTYDKNNFNFEILKIKNDIRKKYSNKEIIYGIRTSIMHGLYTYKNDEFYFWNLDKEKTNKVFELHITYQELLNIINQKEEFFYEHMIYDEKFLQKTNKSLK